MASNKQDGTMELDVNQIDLLDLPVPSSPELDSATPEQGRPSATSKGPPPLPPMPIAAPEPAAKVPSLPPPPEASRGVVSARNLVGPDEGDRNPVKGFLIGLGAAGLVCVVLGIFVFKGLHKKQPVSAPAPTVTASAKAQTFTMAPIEFTASGSAAPEESAAPHTSASVAAPTTTTAQGAPRPSAQGTSKPVTSPQATAHTGGDGILKDEN